MSAIIPNIPRHAATPNPNSLPIHTDASQYPYSYGIDGLQGRSAAPVTGMVSQTADSTAYGYEHVGVIMSEATNAASVTMQREAILPFHCEVCNIYCNTKDVLDAHKQGKKHLKSVKKLAEPSANAPKMVPPAPVEGETLLGELEDKKLRLLQNGAIPETLLYCEICNVICNNQDGFQKHVASKKHSAKLIIQQATPYAVFDATSDSSGGSQPKPGNFPCEICKITCTSNELLKAHIVGKKHLKKVKDLGQIPNLPLTPIASQDTTPIKPLVNPNSNEDKTANLPLTPIVSQGTQLTNPVVNPESNEDKTVNLDGAVALQDTPLIKPVVNTESIEGKTVNLDGAVALQDTPLIKPVVNTESIEGKTVDLNVVKVLCELCGIMCDTNEVLKVHITGKRHKKNLEKSERLIGPNPAFTTEPAEQPRVIGPLQKEGEIDGSNGRKRKGVKGGSDDDVEAKKQRVLQSGTASDAVQICDLCNVVCNSPKVFFSHITGQKHAAMAVKQAETQAGSTTTATGQES